MHIGDRGKSHLKTLLGLLKLTTKRSLLGIGESHRIECSQHIEVALRHPIQKSLPGYLILCFSRSQLRLTFRQLAPIPIVI